MLLIRKIQQVFVLQVEEKLSKFVENYLRPNPGDIVDVETKEVIGRHTGLMNYTIGQKKKCWHKWKFRKTLCMW